MESSLVNVNFSNKRVTSTPIFRDAWDLLFLNSNQPEIIFYAKEAYLVGADKFCFSLTLAFRMFSPEHEKEKEE